VAVCELLNNPEEEAEGGDGSFEKVISTGCDEIPASILRVIGSKGSSVDTSMPPPNDAEGAGAIEIVFDELEPPLFAEGKEILD